MAWQRARSPEQKEERRSSILEAAALMYEDGGLDEISLNGIARRAGISKANIYRYFENREEIFLQLVGEDFSAWVTDVERRLAPLAGGDDERAVARQLVESYLASSRLASLLPLLSSVIERNLSVDVIVRFKTLGLDLMIRLTNAIQVSLPSLTVDQTRRFVTVMHLLLVGGWPAANPPPTVKEALERPELQGMCFDFERDFEEALVTFLRGLRSADAREGV
jgi:AcrR family transcriptional regulator